MRWPRVRVAGRQGCWGWTCGCVVHGQVRAEQGGGGWGAEDGRCRGTMAADIGGSGERGSWGSGGWAGMNRL